MNIHWTNKCDLSHNVNKKSKKKDDMLRHFRKTTITLNKMPSNRIMYTKYVLIPLLTFYSEYVCLNSRNLLTLFKNHCFLSCHDIQFKRLYPQVDHILPGLYYYFIKEWFRAFPREQFMIINFKDYKNNKTKTLNRIFKFLELSKYHLKTTNK